MVAQWRLNQTPTESDGWRARAWAATQPCFAAASLSALRRSLDKRQIPALPGHRCHRLQLSLGAVAKWMPPCVVAAVLRASLNGWMAARRFQQKGRCVLGCQGLEDSVAHYGRCPCYHSLCRRFLNLPRPPAGNDLEEFLLLGTPRRAVRGEGATEGSDHALYRTRNAVRLAGSSGPCADLFRGFLREGIRGHAKASSVLQVAFKRRCHFSSPSFPLLRSSPSLLLVVSRAGAAAGVDVRVGPSSFS